MDSASHNALLSVALRAHNLGLCVVPPREDGSKAPVGGWGKFQKERPRHQQIDAWYGPFAGIGLICGRISGGLESIEFDDLTTYEAYKELAEAADLGDLLERIEAGYLERSPGGIHWLYSCTEIAGNTKLARRPKTSEETRDTEDKTKVLIETRGEGGYLIIAPSGGNVHPSGKSYVLLRGGLETIVSVTPEERHALFELARAFDLMPKPQVQTVPKEPPNTDAARPGDDFDARADWSNVLEAHGWRLIYQREGAGYWRRPGKDRGISATTNWQDSGFLYVFSSSTPFEPERGYSKFAAYTILEHGGDYQAAAGALAKMGFGKYQDDTSSGPNDVPESGSSTSPTSPGFTLTTLSDLLTEPPEKISWVWDQTLPTGGLSILAAKPKVGKSTTVRNLALAVAQGRDFLGRSTSPGPVVYLALEEKRSQVQAHFAAMAAKEEPISVHVGMAPEKAMEELEKVIIRNKPVLVVIDPILRFIRVRDANDYSEVNRAMEPLLNLARVSGAHLLCVHHAGKLDRDGGDSILGSTALFGGVDTALIMRRKEAGRTLESIQRYGTDIPEMVMGFDPDSQTISDAGTIEESEIRRAKERIIEAIGTAAMTQKEIRETVDGRTKHKIAALQRLFTEGELVRAGSGKKNDPFIYSVAPAEQGTNSEHGGFLVPTDTPRTGEPEKSKTPDLEMAPGDGDLLPMTQMVQEQESDVQDVLEL